MIGKKLRSEICWTNSNAIQSLQVLCLSDNQSRFYVSSKFKSGCVNYARFCKSSHIYESVALLKIHPLCHLVSYIVLASKKVFI